MRLYFAIHNFQSTGIELMRENDLPFSGNNPPSEYNPIAYNILSNSNGSNVNSKSGSNIVQNFTCTPKDEKEHLTVIIPDEHYRRSFSEDANTRQLQDSRYISTDSVASSSIAGSRDWLASNNCVSNTAQPSGSSKFGGSNFSITRHKKIDLSAYDEARSQILFDGKDGEEGKEAIALSDKGMTRFESYDVLEKTAAIAFEQVSQLSDCECISIVEI